MVGGQSNINIASDDSFKPQVDSKQFFDHNVRPNLIEIVSPDPTIKKQGLLKVRSRGESEDMMGTPSFNLVTSPALGYRRPSTKFKTNQGAKTFASYTAEVPSSSVQTPEIVLTDAKTD